MNNYFIIGKVNEGKSYLFNLVSKNHKTISNPKANTTIDIIRKNISSEFSEYNIYDTPGFYNKNDFINLLNKILELKLDNVKFLYLTSSFSGEDLKICKILHSKKFDLLLFSFKKIDKKMFISNLFNETFIDHSDNLSRLKKYFNNKSKRQNLNSDTSVKKTISIFGKENTGKSTLFNKIMSMPLSKTSSNLHTTRDSVNWDVRYKNQILEFIDNVEAKIGKELDIDAGYKAAKRCALSIVSLVNKVCNGDLSKVKSCVKLTGYVNSTDDFQDQPKVINGASDLIVSIFGDAGKHSRAAVSTNSLPLGVSVEVDAIFQLN